MHNNNADRVFFKFASYLSYFWQNMSALTPGYFLIGKLFVALPQANVSDVNPGRLKRYQLLTQIVDIFGKGGNKNI